MKARPLDALPLYADDMAIGAAVLGPKRAGEWKALTPLLERKGLPKIDDMHGGRSTDGVRAFYDRYNGIESTLTPDGVEELGAWRNRRKRRA